MLRGASPATAVAGCLATWFTAVAGTPSVTTVPAGGDATVDVTLTMSDPAVNQDACNLTPPLTDGPNVTLDVT